MQCCLCEMCQMETPLELSLGKMVLKRHAQVA